MMSLSEVWFFVLHIGAALVMGVILGMERQLGGHPAGLRTNALVCVGASLFVSLGGIVGHEASPSRIAAAVVSGIGFLGGGVIFREGLNVKGMNTAATLWCSAAVGSLAGAGFPLQGLLGTGAILLLHVTLRPVSRWIDQRTKMGTAIETSYQLKVLCKQQKVGLIRSIIIQHINAHPTLILQGISTRSEEGSFPDRTLIVGDIFSRLRDDLAMEDLMARVSLQPSVISVNWEILRGIPAG